MAATRRKVFRVHPHRRRLSRRRFLTRRHTDPLRVRTFATGCYEIKSDRDDASRLGRQVFIYSAVLDRATLVAGTRASRWALGQIPAWWEVIEAENGRHGVKLTRRRAGRRNPEARSRALIELLWRDETLSLLRHHGIERGVTSKPRGTMWNRAAALLDDETIRRAVADALHARDYRNGWGGTRRVDLKAVVKFETNQAKPRPADRTNVKERQRRASTR